MTLRKYKKILMSYGVDRDYAEILRKQMARRKRGAVELFQDPLSAMFTIEQIKEEVSRMREHSNLSRRGSIKAMKQMMKDITL